MYARHSQIYGQNDLVSNYNYISWSRFITFDFDMTKYEDIENTSIVVLARNKDDLFCLINENNLKLINTRNRSHPNIMNKFICQMKLRYLYKK